MPLKPDVRKFYGRGWKRTRERILQRAGGKCEACKVPNRALVLRGPGGVWVTVPYPPRVVEFQPGKPLEGFDVWRGPDGTLQDERFSPEFADCTMVSIVLTVAHLDRTPGNYNESNLKALCQWCHLNYDRPVNLSVTRQTRKTRKDAARPLLGGE